MKVTYIAYNSHFEKDFPVDITLKEIHEYLYDICHTYIITEVKLKEEE